MESGHTSTARAGTNIALVKYWGKRTGPFNVPAAASLSLTLAGLGTTTTVTFDERLAPDGDVFSLNDAPMDAKAAARASRFLDLVRARAQIAHGALVHSRNTVPTAAGLASSASGFAALALAACHAAGLHPTATDLSIRARQGSGSAARSIFGGFVLMSAGERADGEDAFASQLLDHTQWDIAMVVALTSQGPKTIGSTEAMQHTAKTSPFYQAWLHSVPNDVAEAREALAQRDLKGLGEIAERSCLRMHASAMASDPGILYWNPVTLSVIQAVMRLRTEGLNAYFTIDAGPHGKVLCATNDAEAVAAALGAVCGVQDVVTARPGPGAHLIGAPSKASSP
jgi:diphosphomevalonate decarboxylase